MENLLDILSKYLFIILFVVGWISIPIFLYYSYQNKRKREWVESQQYTLVKITVPKENEKGPLSAEQMFASLHGIFKPFKERKKEGSFQEHVSFEIVSSKEKISFYVWLPVHLRDFVEGQIYAQYPKAEFTEADDYSDKDFSNFQVVGSDILLNKNDVFPIKTFINFEEVDPLSGITSVLSKIEDDNDEIWIQILVKPMEDTWQEKGLAYVNAIRDGKSPEARGIISTLKDGVSGFGKDLFKAIVTPPDQLATAQPVKLASGDEAKIKAIEEKISKLGFSVRIRTGYISKNKEFTTAKIKLQSVIGAFKQFNTLNLNGFQGGKILTGDNFVGGYRSRLFIEDGFVLNIEELASIFHLPNVSVETPRIDWTGSKKGEPPESLPVVTGTESDKELSVFAETNFRNRSQKFGIKTDDRRRHMYIIGKTGVGKTNMMESMVISDINAGHGVAIVDPHGEFVDEILKYIPKHRINDVILFNPSDNEYPIAFNPLETVSPDQKNLVTSGLVSIFQKIWKDSWGPRLEYILRNTIISLLDYPDSTMLGILRILVDKDYRKKVIEKINDPVVYDFWTKEFAQYNEKTRVDAILPIQNKVGQFLSSSTIRNIVGQPKSKIDISEIMDNKKILLLRLAQGQIGEDNSALLGAMMITKIQLAAMSRVNIPEEQRNDFYLYVDEFQNFATDSFAKILSEARKYRLNLIVANQYIAQLSEPVRDAIFGNVGSLVSFRVGANDSTFLAKEYAPVFDENDLVNLDKYQIYLKLSIDGITGNAFSSKTLKIPDEKDNYAKEIIENTRQRYSTERSLVEKMINSIAGEEKSIFTTEESEKNSVKDDQSKSYEEYLDYLQKVKDGIEEVNKNCVKNKDDKEEEKSKPGMVFNLSEGDNNYKDKQSEIANLTSKITKDKVIPSSDLKKESGDKEYDEKKPVLRIKKETVISPIPQNQVSNHVNTSISVNSDHSEHKSHAEHIKHRINMLREKSSSHTSVNENNNDSKKEIKPGEVIKFDN